MSLHISSFLTGKNIDLRELRPEDADYYRWFNDIDTCSGNSHHVYPMTHQDALDYINGIDCRTLALAIIDKKVGSHIGNISLQNIHPTYHSAELAIILGSKRGKGYGLEAANLICEHGFNAMNLHRISCGTFRHNIAMQKIAVKLGMKLEGIRREAAYKDGKWVDVFEYGMVRFDK